MPRQSPCTKDCPRRSIDPNCHNVDICPEWAEYMTDKVETDTKARTARDVAAIYYNYAKAGRTKQLRKLR